MHNIRLIKRNSPTWKVIISALKDRFGDISCTCHETGEQWQYMGSIALSPEIADNTLVEHQFRHRNLHGRRQYFSVHTPYEACKDDFLT